MSKWHWACVLTIVLALATAAVPATAADDAAAVAQQYLSLWKAGKTSEGIARLWDLDAMFTDLFADDYTRMAEADRLYLKQVAIVFFAAANRLPGLMATLKDANIEIETTEAAGNRAVVRGAIKLKEEERKIAVTLIKSGETWKIINIGHGERDLTALKPEWRKYKAERGPDSMVEWFDIMLLQILEAHYPGGQGRAQ